MSDLPETLGDLSSYESAYLPWRLFEALPGTDRLSICYLREDQEYKYYHLYYDDYILGEISFDLTESTIDVY